MFGRVLLVECRVLREMSGGHLKYYSNCRFLLLSRNRTKTWCWLFMYKGELRGRVRHQILFFSISIIVSDNSFGNCFKNDFEPWVQNFNNLIICWCYFSEVYFKRVPFAAMFSLKFSWWCKLRGITFESVVYSSPLSCFCHNRKWFFKFLLNCFY